MRTVAPRTACVAAVLLGAAGPVRAHGEDVDAHTLWTAWSLDPWVSVPLALMAVGYLVGTARLWRNGRTGAGVSIREVLLFWSGWVAMLVALLSPLDALGNALFSAHMVQHEVLMLVAAPLLVLGKPLPVWLWAVPARWRGAVGRATRGRWLSVGWEACTRPLVAWLIHAAVLWVWHLPVFFQAAVGDNGIHTFQHLAFVLSALLFWWAMFDPRHGLLRPAVGALYIFTTALHTSVLGALLTFSSTPWYPVYAATAPEWGLSAIEDQQVGGLIMWVPGGIVYVVVTLWLLARMLDDPGHRQAARPALTRPAR